MEQWFVAAKRADFKALAKQLQVSDVLVRLMRNRDMTTTEEMRRYLCGSLSDLYDPCLLKDVQKGVRIVKEKICAGEKMRIISDYDVDGVCANYILYKGLKRCGADVDSVIPHRVKDGYGINETLIQNACDAGVRTLITCDNGIAAWEPIARAGALGMTTIILDHHDIPFEETDGEKQYKIPPAAAVINPKQEDCAYPEKNICGAVVTFKFIQILYRAFGIPEEEVRSFLEFAALGTVCDVMPLKGDNRIIAKEGLKRFAGTANLGLQALLMANHLTEKKLTAYHLGFIIGPCINASGRLDTAKKALDLFLCEDRAACASRAEELVALNIARKEMTRIGEEAADEYLKTGGYLADKVLVVYLPEVHESIAGIIAGRIREKYNKPTFVITRADDGLKGSGRSIEAYPMFESLVKVKDCMTKFGGHPMAAGLSMEEDRLEEFRRRLNADAKLTEEDFVKKIVIDVPVPFSYLSLSFIEELNLLEPFGTGNPAPLFAQKDLDILSVRSLGDKGRVLKMDLKYDGGYAMDAIYFGEEEEFFKEMEAVCGAEEVRRVKNGLAHRVLMDCVYYPEIHEWRGQQSIQVVIKYYRFKKKTEV